MIVGIDIGGSTTDAVILENGGIHVVTIEANDPVAAAAGALGKLVVGLRHQTRRRRMRRRHRRGLARADQVAARADRW